MLSISMASFPVHASGPYGETYSFSQSTSRIQETNSPSITFVLNVTTPLAGINYQFSWAVTDPTGALQTTTTTVNSVPSTFTTSVTYPTNFGSANITYVGEYNITVSQTSPPPTTKAATSLFQVGLTDAEEYQRTQPVFLGVGETNLEEACRCLRSWRWAGLANCNVVFSNIGDVGTAEIRGISYAGCESRWDRVHCRSSSL